MPDESGMHTNSTETEFRCDVAVRPWRRYRSECDWSLRVVHGGFRLASMLSNSTTYSGYYSSIMHENQGFLVLNFRDIYAQLVKIQAFSVNGPTNHEGTWQTAESTIDGPWSHLRLVWIPEDDPLDERRVRFRTSWCAELTR